MLELISKFHQARLLVIGDVMLDRYWEGDCNRISPEAPVPVVRVTEQHDRPGGAGNVAVNLTALEAQCVLAGAVGHDLAADQLESSIAERGVATELIRLPELSTIVKQRITSLHQQLVRFDIEQERPMPAPKAAFDAMLARQLPNTQVMILSDYAKGTLAHCPELIAQAKRCHIPILVDPKGTDYSIYRGATLITPNKREFEAAFGHFDSEAEMVAKAQAALIQFDWEAMLITRSAEGMSLVQRGESPIHLPAHAREVFDVTGAGDTVIAVMALSMAVGASLADAMYLANIAASLVVAQLGAATISVAQLRRAVNMHLGRSEGILTPSDLLLAVQDAKAHGERIVMTNGCFDILHVGHVTYLEEARALGDRLIIAVNSDASVKRLKGPTRPINSADSRMKVLMGLRAVDWVVEFDEDTPRELITKIAPDILVKGGDYEVHQIAGASEVLAKGGDVKILPFVPGFSTSAVLNKVNEGNDSCLS
jgi:D-beta-D-heptose 7-phosphate kinase/D-beta-D-heptose 1-phosphate adenosyltransferase